MAGLRIINTLSTFWKKYNILLLSAVLCIYSLPQSFFVAPGGELDGSWTRAMNMAVKDHLVFGTDIVFTYGPLSFLSTRNGQYLNGFSLLAADAFLVIGLYYIIRRYLSQYKGCFFILLAAMLCFKDSNYVQALFLIFTIFTIFCFSNNFKNYFELVYCAVAGILLFFIKINYGLISVLILFLIAIVILVKNRKSFLVFTAVSLTFFAFVYFNVHIDLLNYVKNGLLLMRYYDEAMFIPIQQGQLAFIAALIFISAFAIIMFCYMVAQSKRNDNKTDRILSLLLFSVACFLFYKNGFTRYDYFHYYDFYSVFPLFIILVLFHSGFGRFYISKILSVCISILSVVNLKEYPLTGKIATDYLRYATYTSVVNYFSGIFKKQVEFISVNIPGDELKLIGNATIDIMPKQIALLQLNHLNYDPRPVIQTYSAYCGALDSLNAGHFCSSHRPEMIMISYGSINDRYFAWDESLTKATLHLNYYCRDSIFLDSMDHNTPCTFLLLRSKKESHTLPLFDKISELTINFDDTAHISFPDSTPVYMTAEIAYNSFGQLKKIFYQPPLISITLLTDSNNSITYRVVRPIVAYPVLINKYIGGNTDFKNFINGDIKNNANISGFVFHANGDGVKQKIKITFLRFRNY